MTSQGEAIAEQSKGGRVSLLFSNYGRNESTPRAPPRVKVEAADNYHLNRGIIYNYIHSKFASDKSCSLTFVFYHACDVFKGCAMNSLLHDVKSVPKSARPGPRVKPEAEDNAMKNRGSMNSIMRVCTPRY